MRVPNTRAMVVGAAGLFVVVGVTIWMTVATFRELEAGLESERQRSASLTQQLNERMRTLERTRSDADEAREEALTAQQKAEAQSAAARAAEEAARTAAEEKRAAEQEKYEAEKSRLAAERAALDARERENLARTELAELHQRRERELNRMQQALSRIAPTRRTTSGMVIELANDSFYFDFDNANLRSENREILSRIAGVLLASEGYRLFVYGHTDDTGPDDYNQDLSLRRAKSVADYLQEAGVPEDAIRVKGFGKSSPRVKNDSGAARQKNRRVEIGIVDSIIEYKGMAPEA